ncbi:MAG TPA: diguanylate cyclase [Nitrospirota bacterium]|nr:diguanylate cyclase [Nitrospirota bacterium]
MRVFLTNLDQAIYNHNQWYESFIRTLICHLPCDRRDISRDAHRECLFGQWFYSSASKKLRDHPGFEALGVEHERMHGLAAEILETEAAGNGVSLFEFERFNNILGSMRLQLFTLKRELEDLLYNRDPLTRAHSRIGMLTKLRELQELVKRGIQSCSIAMMDLDNFKAVNDTYGHPAGDRVLAGVSYYIMEHLRPFDRIFRYGGEEFLITLQHTDGRDGLEAVERLRIGISENAVVFDGQKIGITASFGLALLDPDVSVEQAVERADKALYCAKAAGRNCTMSWDPLLHDQPHAAN